MLDRDDIIRMAREACFVTGSRNMTDGSTWAFAQPVAIGNCLPELERFAALVAAHEREQCAKVCDLPDFYEDWEIAGGAEGRELMNGLAAAIRARGQT